MATLSELLFHFPASYFVCSLFSKKATANSVLFPSRKMDKRRTNQKKKKPFYHHNIKKLIRYVGYIWSHQILRDPSKLNVHFFIFCKSCFLSFSVLHFLSACRCGEFCRAFTLILFSPSATHPPSTTSECLCACVRVFVCVCVFVSDL